MTQRSIWITTLLVGLAVFSSTAVATTGYFGLGYGAKAMGMAGAVVSNPQDALAASTNPAGMADLDAAADRIASAIRSREPIAVFGDYDCDGNFEIAGWVRNVSDQRYKTFAFSAANFANVVINFVSDPRTAGVDLTFSF